MLSLDKNGKEPNLRCRNKEMHKMATFPESETNGAIRKHQKQETKRIINKDRLMKKIKQ